jgi:RimJ/RimL family protein N-acetyltransferase
MTQPADVRLRAVDDSDLDTLFQQQADPEAVEMAVFPARDRERFDAHWAKIRGDDTVVARTVLADGVVAGWIGSWHDGEQQLLGYWIGREHWGHGIATRALTLILGEVPARPMYAHVAENNAGSIRVLQKCGFHRDHVREKEAPEPEDGVKEFIFVLAG